MVSHKKKSKKNGKRVPRTCPNMRRANLKTDPKPKEKIRKKIAPQPTERARRKQQYVVEYRDRLGFDALYRAYAISAASQKWRKIVKGQGKRKKGGSVGRPPKLAFRPKNYDALLELIPMCHRAKPTQAGQKIVYVPHEAALCTAWIHAKVIAIARHKDSNWVLVRKPLAIEKGKNPYVAIDSTNVFLEPPKDIETATFCDVGVYVLYCESLNKFYVGESNNIEARIKQHKSGRGAKATKNWPSFVRVPPLTKRKASESLRQWERREWDANRKKFGYLNVRGAGASQE